MKKPGTRASRGLPPKQNIKQMAYARSLAPMMLEMRGKGFSLQAVADNLNSRRIFTSRGNSWSNVTIRQSLILAEKPDPAFPTKPLAGNSERTVGWVLTEEVAWKHFFEMKQEPKDIAVIFNQTYIRVMHLLAANPAYPAVAEERRLAKRKADPDRCHEMYTNGVSQHVIAKILKCDRRAVHNALKQFADYDELTQKIIHQPRGMIPRLRPFTPTHLTRLSASETGTKHHPTPFQRLRMGASQRNRADRIRLTHDGQRLTIPQWAERIGMKKGTLHARRRKGLPVEQILTTKLDTHSGERYVLWRSDAKKWFVCIDRKKYGTFDNLDDAIARRDEVLARHRDG